MRAGVVTGVLREVVFFPLLAWLIRDRRVAGGFLLTALVLGGLHAVGYSIWRCPIHSLTGWECPGCGLTRGAGALGRGDLAAALEFHFFTPVFVGGALVLAVGVVLPGGYRDRYARLVERFEVTTGITAIILVAAVIYGLTRNVWSE